ncbi:hypothetical protein ACH5RR_006536 [Cinchona calisaya]|uniref:Uncharacterized protein n=1 Tax=Cinchona calisaya TaxID=153742 RepID=A0ABD3AP99_9GENT
MIGNTCSQYLKKIEKTIKNLVKEFHEKTEKEISELKNMMMEMRQQFLQGNQNRASISTSRKDALSKLSYGQQPPAVVDLKAISILTSDLLIYIQKFGRRILDWDEIKDGNRDHHYRWHKRLLKRKEKLIVGDSATLRSKLLELYHASFFWREL